jgi:hypothetical protein
MPSGVTRYFLADHVLSDNVFTNDPVWTRMDAVCDRTTFEMRGPSCRIQIK